MSPSLNVPIGGGAATVIQPGQTTVYTLLGERFAHVNGIPQGDAEFDATFQGWVVSEATWNEIKSRSQGTQLSIVQKLRQARKEGSRVVAGVVQFDARRRAPVQQVKGARGILESLNERARGLVRQIAELTDAGPIPEGQMAELTKTVAALQAERDEAVALLSEIEGNLSLGRGLVIEYSMAP